MRRVMELPPLALYAEAERLVMPRRRTFMPNRTFLRALVIALIGFAAISIVGHAMHRDVAACDKSSLPCNFP